MTRDMTVAAAAHDRNPPNQFGNAYQIAGLFARRRAAHACFGGIVYKEWSTDACVVDSLSDVCHIPSEPGQRPIRLANAG
jgi:hypothetical protein